MTKPDPTLSNGNAVSRDSGVLHSRLDDKAERPSVVQWCPRMRRWQILIIASKTDAMKSGLLCFVVHVPEVPVRVPNSSPKRLFCQITGSTPPQKMSLECGILVINL